MTFQSSPYMPWIFPDEAYHMNKRGIHPLKPVPIRDSYEPLPGGGSEAQTMFDDHDRKVALERVRMNKKKEQGMLGHLNTTARSQRYDRPASRSAVHNGIFEGSPMEYLTSAGLRGGRVNTREGQEWLAKRLQQRYDEYGQLRSGVFSGPPKTIPMTPFSNIDTLFQVAFTAVTSGTFSGSINDTLNQILQALIRAGATITSSQLTTYAQAIGTMTQTIRAYIQEGDSPTDKAYFKVQTIANTLDVVDAAIREIARVIDQPIAARQQVMTTLASRLFGRQLEQRAMGGEPFAPVQMGQATTGAVSRDVMNPLGEEEEEEDSTPSLPPGMAGYPAAFEAEAAARRDAAAAQPLPSGRGRFSGLRRMGRY